MRPLPTLGLATSWPCVSLVDRAFHLHAAHLIISFVANAVWVRFKKCPPTPTLIPSLMQWAQHS